MDVRLVAVALLLCSVGCLGIVGDEPAEATSQPPEMKLVVQDHHDGTLGVTLSYADNGTQLYEEQFGRGDHGEIDVSDRFPSRATVTASITVDGTNVWEETVQDYEGYEVTIHATGDVTVGQLEV